MTPTEIKAAWNIFKKESKKQVSFDMTGCCYMNAKQIANGTATIALCNDIEYDVEIDRSRRDDERVQGYDTWTTEEKARSKARHLELRAGYEAKKAAYGTKANEAQTKATEITSTAAFQKLAKAIGIHAFELELVKKWGDLNLYQVRIHY